MTFDAKELSVKYMAQLSTTPVQCSTLSSSLPQLHKYWEQIMVRINIIIFSNVMQQSMAVFHTVTIKFSVHKWKKNAPITTIMSRGRQEQFPVTQWCQKYRRHQRCFWDIFGRVFVASVTHTVFVNCLTDFRRHFSDSFWRLLIWPCFSQFFCL